MRSTLKFSLLGIVLFIMSIMPNTGYSSNNNNLNEENLEFSTLVKDSQFNKYGKAKEDKNPTKKDDEENLKFSAVIESSPFDGRYEQLITNQNPIQKTDEENLQFSTLIKDSPFNKYGKTDDEENLEFSDIIERSSLDKKYQQLKEEEELIEKYNKMNDAIMKHGAIFNKEKGYISVGNNYGKLKQSEIEKYNEIMKKRNNSNKSKEESDEEFIKSFGSRFLRDQKYGSLMIVNVKEYKEKCARFKRLVKEKGQDKIRAILKDIVDNDLLEYLP